MSDVLIQQYLNELQDLRRVSGTSREMVVREAFKDLLKGWGRSKDLVFVPEYEIETPAKRRPGDCPPGRPHGGPLHHRRQRSPQLCPRGVAEPINATLPTLAEPAPAKPGGPHRGGGAFFCAPGGLRPPCPPAGKVL